MIIAIYFLIAIFAYRDGITGITTHSFGAIGDFYEFIWYVGWIPHSILHALNPFWTDALNVPIGVNLGQNTEAPFLGLLTSPISWLLGPLVAANFVLLISMPISATAAYVVFRKWRVWIVASALGGLMYGYSAYMIGQSLGHPQLTFVPIPPLIALVVVSIVNGKSRPLVLGCWLGVLVAVQYLISPEILASVSLFLALAALYVTLFHRELILRQLKPILTAFSTAVGLSALLLAYPIWFLVAGPQHAAGPTYPLENPYHNDLLSFIVPSPLQSLQPVTKSEVLRVLGYSNVVEAGGYIGLPLILIACVLAWRSRKVLRTQIAFLIMSSAAVLSLGPYLTINGRISTFRLPFILIAHIPLFNNLLPARLSYEVSAGVTALIAFGLDDLHKGLVAGTRSIAAHGSATHQWTPWLVALVALGLVVATQLPRWPYLTPEAAPYPVALRDHVPPNNPVTLTYPYDTASVVGPMFWQATSDYSFRIFGAYAYMRSANGSGTILPAKLNPPQLQHFLVAQEGAAYLGPRLPITENLIVATRQTVTAYQVRQVIVDTSTGGSRQVMKLFEMSFGQPTESFENFEIWINPTGVPKGN